jgi:hypothetical protein
VYADYPMGAWAANDSKGIRNYIYSVVRSVFAHSLPKSFFPYAHHRTTRSILRPIRISTSRDTGECTPLAKSGQRCSGLCRRG